MTQRAGKIRTPTKLSFALQAVRGGYGALQLIRPGSVVQLLLEHPMDERGRRIARVLGVRQLAQALASGPRPGYPMLALGVEVDLAHAASMLTLGLVDRRRRRAACVDALIAGSFALAGALAARTTPRPGTLPPAASGLDRLRERYANLLASLTVPGYRT